MSSRLSPVAVVVAVLSLAVVTVTLVRPTVARAQAPATSARALADAINKLGELDYTTRAQASRAIRRTPPAEAVPALLDVVASHPDGYVRFRALVLLTGFNDPRTVPAMIAALTSPNDRLRTVAYGFFEHDRADVSGRLVAALDTELSQFVRPALVRALAARATTESVQKAVLRESTRGEDFFRSAVIEALGDYKATYAVATLIDIVRLDGPLADEAALALGKIGDRRAVPVLGELRKDESSAGQPAISAALCLLDTNAASEEQYLEKTLAYTLTAPDAQSLLSATTRALATLGVAGRESAIRTLIKAGASARASLRDPVSLALATIAMRNTPAMLAALDGSDKVAGVQLLAEGFEALEEDLEKERFFATVRRTYWESPEGSSRRDLMRLLIEKLDF